MDKRTRKPQRERMRKYRKMTDAKINQLAKMYASGQFSQREMAKQLGVDQKTLWPYLVQLRTDWRKERLDNVETARERELSKLDLLEEESLSAWERSQGDEVKVETDFTDAKTGKKSKETRVGQAGDPRFLTQIEKCIKGRREILGLDAPAKSEHQHSGNMAYAMLTPDQLREEILSRLEKPGAASDDSPTPAAENEDG